MFFHNIVLTDQMPHKSSLFLRVCFVPLGMHSKQETQPGSCCNCIPGSSYRSLIEKRQNLEMAQRGHLSPFFTAAFFSSNKVPSIHQNYKSYPLWNGKQQKHALLLKWHPHSHARKENHIYTNTFWVHPSVPPPSNHMLDSLALLHGNCPAATGSRAQTGIL